MNLRQAAYFALFGLRGQPLGTHYQHMLREYQEGIPPDTTQRLLIRLLAHCKQSVPYYARVIRDLGDSFYEDPEEYLRRFPILTKGIIRSHFNELQSTDLARRRWYRNTSGGSTGEPVMFIQDWEYAARSGAITLLFSKLAGREIGEPEVRLWGSIHDIEGTSERWTARLVNKLANTTFLSVFRLGPSNMREYIRVLNAKRPKLIVAYAAAMYELARFAEQEGLAVVPQASVIATAGTLYPFMRQTIERVFQCKVFDRYGSREVGDIACEGPVGEGLWVAPWGNYLEIVDDEGNRVPNGTSGEILVTSLSNFVMPLVRYRIEDRGVLSSVGSDGGKRCGQVLEGILGRSYALFVNRHGTPVEGGHFMALLYFRDWISKYQVIQRDHSQIVFRFVRAGPGPQPGELDEISAKTRLIMDDDVNVTFEFLDDIVPSNSGKYRFIISEVTT